ncbi:MAG: ABC transporter permease [Chloroflexi bacterium]|nr:ABC transporter permease [Chloroflexota bacterium]
MAGYIGRRVLQIIPLLFALSIIIFIVIQLPPGDYLTMYMQQLRNVGAAVSESEIANLTQLYALDRPIYEQYYRWITNILLRGDFGMSFQWNRPVAELVGERLLLTMTISIATLLFTWIVSLPIGIYSATHQYSLGDYALTFIGFIGISLPGFLIALVIMYSVFAVTGTAITGLFSPQFIAAPWSWAKIEDALKHVWLPMVIVGLSGTASLIRTMRAMMLDELQQQYVTTARARGVKERKLLFKYPVRLALNPMISTIGWLLPTIVSGEALVSIVLNMPTTGPMLLQSLLAQDMYLAGSILLITSTLTVIGTLLSDILLAWLDPRIRFGAVAEEA